MKRSVWRQLSIAFPDPRTAAATAVAHLAPILVETEARRLITAWFVVRKGVWRLRYRPVAATAEADSYLIERLSSLQRAGHVVAIVRGVYEPELHAFGGTMAMEVAHRLWHEDSRHLFDSPAKAEPKWRREMSIVLCAAMMRAAGLDWYEQGDVWARTVEHRDPAQQALVEDLLGPVRRLLTVDPSSLTDDGGPLADACTWIKAYTAAGAALRQLNDAGQLHRGIRSTLTHHVIFTWNRRGIPGPHQAALATAARTVVFGPDPANLTHPWSDVDEKDHGRQVSLDRPAPSTLYTPIPAGRRSPGTRR
ncbi:thiopeptide-type bacteriocin biosynthesis protein [Jiangella muralis]|uniref:thiopeptide-type bacteriocin biosynthesis protein n=1 Tax=Jiangella muralis TaxID=702383 RepID=UPI0009FB48F6|nr:thiopeptide-type bacteriocin biosynthesis protein [Jiangella muralis]